MDKMTDSQKQVKHMEIEESVDPEGEEMKTQNNCGIQRARIHGESNQVWLDVNLCEVRYKGIVQIPTP